MILSFPGQNGKVVFMKEMNTKDWMHFVWLMSWELITLIMTSRQYWKFLLGINANSFIKLSLF